MSECEPVLWRPSSFSRAVAQCCARLRGAGGRGPAGAVLVPVAPRLVAVAGD